jgi:hypothetical protein
MDTAETRTATNVQTPARMRTGVGSLEPEPEPAMASDVCIENRETTTNRYK